MATNVHRFSDTLQFLSDIGSELISENETYGIRTLVVRIYRVVQEGTIVRYVVTGHDHTDKLTAHGRRPKTALRGPGKGWGTL